MLFNTLAGGAGGKNLYILIKTKKLVIFLKNICATRKIVVALY